MGLHVCFSCSPVCLITAAERQTGYWRFTLTMFQQIAPFKVAVFLHGWKISISLKTTSPPFPGRSESRGGSEYACSSNCPYFISAIYLIAGFSYALALHCAAEELHKSQRKCVSLWVLVQVVSY